VTLPGRFEFGTGIETDQEAIRYGVPEDVGMNSSVLSRLDTLLWNAIEDSAFPGAAIAIGRGTVIAKTDGYGYFTYDSEQRTTSRSLFDLASLTKVVATTPAVMLLYDRGEVKLDEPVATYLPEFGTAGKDSVTIRHLLTHTSGLAPFYPFEQMGITTRDGIIDFIAADSLRFPPDSVYRYSDLGMIILAETVGRITGQDLGAFVAENIYDPLGMHDTGFRPVGERAIDESVVPTEIDTIFRKRLIQGEVHDERAWVMGGTAGHAGLFSTAEDLARYASMLINGGSGNGVQIFKPETIALFTTRFPNEIGSTRALGWDTKSQGDYSSAGEFFGPNSYGHTGFTGTSIWIDPDADLFVILLSNRVYPTRQNHKILAIRPRVADLAALSLTGGTEVDLSQFKKEPF
jgi:CubicO group peptidase (beta-lactamase class C family)